MNNLLLLAQDQAAAAAATSASTGSTALQIVFGGVYVLVCLALIGCILMKIPKNDGMGGLTGGGSDPASFKGAKSKDDTIDTITNWIAVAFLAMSVGLNYVF